MKLINKSLQFILLALFCVGANFCAGAKTVLDADTLMAEDVFMKLPVSVLDLLNESSRQYMVEYLHNDSIVTVLNDLGGESRIIEDSPSFMKVSLTPVSSLQIKILENKKSGRQTVMTIYNIENESTAGDSDISFFNAALHPLKEKSILRRPQLKDFFDIPKGSLTSFKEIEQMIPFPTFLFEANPDDESVTVRLTVDKAISQDDLKILNLFLIPELTYKWNGKKLELCKNQKL